MNAKYGRVFSSFSLFNKHIFIYDPELIGQILNKYFDAFTDHVIWNLGPSPVANKFLFFMSGNEDWKRIHSLSSPAFTAAKLKAMVPQISSICDQLIERLVVFAESGQVVDIHKYIGSLTMDSIASVGYGIKTNAIDDPDHPFIINSQKIALATKGPRMVLCALMPKLARLLRVNFFDGNAINYFTEMTKHIIKERTTQSFNEKKSSDFMQLMVDSYVANDDIQCENSSTGSHLSFDEIAAQAAIFISAAQGTTEDAFCHAIFYLCEHKYYQQKLYEELQEVEDFSFDNLIQLKWLNAIINETLRLSPPFLIIPRVCVKDIELSGLKIPAGASVEIMSYVVHRDADYWPEPDIFKPERFFKPTHNQWAFIPFGGGPRICIGRNFALNELRIGLAKIFHKFDLSLAPGFKPVYYDGHGFLTLKYLNIMLKSRDKKVDKKFIN